MKSSFVMVARILTIIFALTAAPAANAQSRSASQLLKMSEQAKARLRPPVVPPRYRPLPSGGSVAPTVSIFQAVPAQLSTARRPVVGQRQTAANLVPANGPLERVNQRIETRVQSRIINRLDRSGEAAPVLSPFATAADRARIAVTRRQ